MDFDARSINLDVSQEEIDKRLAEWKPLEHKDLQPGCYLDQYRQLVQPLAEGAVLGERHFRKK